MLIVDDHPIVLEGTKNIVEAIDNITIEIESDASRVLQKVEKNPFNIYLIDINMPILNGVILAKNIKLKQPNAAIILYTGDDVSDYYSLILERQINAIIPKTASKEKIIRTIHSVIHGEIILSNSFLDFLERKFKVQEIKLNLKLNEKEKKILQLIADGYTNKAIAVDLKITQRTVERYLTQLFTLLNVQSRSEAIAFAREKDLL